MTSTDPKLVDRQLSRVAENPSRLCRVIAS